MHAHHGAHPKEYPRMQTQSFILGKDTSLESTASTLLAAYGKLRDA